MTDWRDELQRQWDEAERRLRGQTPTREDFGDEADRRYEQQRQHQIDGETT